jgi:hypothetical protein
MVTGGPDGAGGWADANAQGQDTANIVNPILLVMAGILSRS